MAKIAEVQEVTVSLLKPYENNAKQQGKEQIEKLKSSILEFGFLTPCLIDREYNIIAGHGRVMAAKELGMEAVPCVFIEGLTEAQRRAYILADNRLGELGEWDMDLVNCELLALLDMDFDISLTGFDQLCLTEFEEMPDIVEDDYSEDVESRCKTGDVWELGEHRLICGDSTDVNVIIKLMDGESADLLLTDPPYNVDYTGKTKDALKIQNDSMENEAFRNFLKEAFISADNVMRPGASFYIWHADSEGYNFRGACNDAGWKVRQCLIWVKNSMVMGRQDYQWQHEPCLYGWKEGASHDWYSDRKQTTTLDFNKPTKSELHPTMKPVELFAYLIKNSSKKGQIVLDTFGGSGTTIIACEQLDRRGFMVELDPHYCDVIINRWETLTGRGAVLVNG